MNKNLAYLALLIAREVYETIDEEELLAASEKLITNQEKFLDKEEIDYAHVIVFGILEDFFKKKDREDNYDQWFYEEIDFDPYVAHVWKEGVKRKLTIKMTYTSETSGTKVRKVDPYKTKTPYGEGWCHIHKEERKFRFDRVSKIELTKKTFTPK